MLQNAPGKYGKEYFSSAKSRYSLVEEKKIIDGLKSGDSNSYREFVNLFSGKVYNTSLGLLQDSSDAEDITQEVFIEVFNSISGFKSQSSLSTWLYRITINRCLDLIRKKKRKKRFALVKSIFVKEDRDDEIPDFIHPGVILENREKSKIIFGSINRLPDNQRIAFTLNKIEDMSYKEISEIMNTSVSSVESLIHRAKENLKKLLKEYYKEY